MEKERYWSRFAEDFEEKTKYVVGVNDINAVKEKLMIQQNLKNILEVGCGPGTYTSSILEQADHITATDLSDEMIEAIKSKFANSDKITVEKANCYSIPYQDNCFDTVFMANLLHVIPNPEKAVLEAHRVLKTKGLLIVVSFTSEGMTILNKICMMRRYLKAWGKPPSNGSMLTVKKTIDMLRKTGFNIREAELLGNKSKSVFVTADRT